MLGQMFRHHSPKDKLDLHYYRSTAFDARLEAMNVWASFCNSWDL